jgi:hypothetical protein
LLTTTPTFTHTVQCADGSFFDGKIVTVPADVTLQLEMPYNPFITRTRLGSFLAPVEIVLNGSVTVHNGAGGVDEQVIHTRYNNLTMIWDTTGTPDTATEPFLTLRGQAMQYTVLDPQGNPAYGTTRGGPNHVNPKTMAHLAPIDGMEIEELHFESDLDGSDNLVWETGEGEIKGGSDNEDGAFAFAGPGGGIVAVTDQNGRYGIHLVGINAGGNPIYNLSAYEKGAGEANRCGVPANAPCKITIELDPKLRTFTVTAITGCTALNSDDIPKLAGVKF